MNLEDNLCPICLYIFIQPVTMPCSHELCLTCFQENVEKANFCCPMCRMRISSWARTAARKKQLVNEKRWRAIKREFADHVKLRLEGLEEEDEEMNALNISIKLAEPGEIRNEYEEQLRRLREQRTEERRLEMEASERLIQQLQEEEKAKLVQQQEILRQDEQFARKLSQLEDPDENPAPPTRTSSRTTTNPSRCETSSSCELLLDTSISPVGPNDSPLPLSSYLNTSAASPETGLVHASSNSSLEPGRKSSVKDGIMKNIKQDKNLITTQDIEALEESFRVKKNTSSVEGLMKSCSTQSLISGNESTTLHRQELLDQMTENICITLDDEESNQSVISNPIPIFPTAVGSPLTGKSGKQGKLARSNATATVSQKDIEMNIDIDGDLESEVFSPGLLNRPHSSDSISNELNHFRPIRSCPLTPPRRLPSGQVVEPVLIRTTPRNLSKSGLGSPFDEDMVKMAEIDAGSPIMKRRLSELAEERKDKVNKMSKSTCTIGGQIVTRDENKNPNHLSHQRHIATSPGLIGRDADFKDISNAAVKTNDRIGVKKKLIIPLEPDLTENDELELIEPMQILKQSSPLIVNEANPAQNTSRLSRRRREGKSSKKKYTENAQCSLMRWAKPLESLQSDEADQAADAGACGDTSDFVNMNNYMHASPRSRRLLKAHKDPDYFYENWKRKRTESDTNSAGGTLDNGDDFCDFSPAKRKRLLVFDDPLPERSNGTKTVCDKKSATSTGQSDKNEKTDLNKRGFLKQHKQPLKATKSNLRKQKGVSVIPKKSTSSSRTLCEFFGKGDAENRKIVLTQEEMDRRMAQELQKQFEIEEKLQLTALRFKGSNEEYSLRRTRRRNVLADTETC